LDLEAVVPIGPTLINNAPETSACAALHPRKNPKKTGSRPWPHNQWLAIDDMFDAIEDQTGLELFPAKYYAKIVDDLDHFEGILNKYRDELMFYVWQNVMLKLDHPSDVEIHAKANACNAKDMIKFRDRALAGGLISEPLWQKIKAIELYFDADVFDKEVIDDLEQKIGTLSFEDARFVAYEVLKMANYVEAYPAPKVFRPEDIQDLDLWVRIAERSRSGEKNGKAQREEALKYILLLKEIRGQHDPGLNLNPDVSQGT